LQRCRLLLLFHSLWAVVWLLVAWVWVVVWAVVVVVGVDSFVGEFLADLAWIQ